MEHKEFSTKKIDEAGPVQLAEAFVEYVGDTFGIEIGYGESDLEIVDSLQESISAEMEEIPKETARVATTAIAAYFGEVLRRNLGGQWVEHDFGLALEYSEPTSWYFPKATVHDWLADKDQTLAFHFRCMYQEIADS